MEATTPIDRVVGQRLAEARRAAGLSVRQLANQIGWPFTTLANYETGRRPITLERLTAIATALQREPASFLVALPEAAAIIEAIASDVERCIQVRIVLDTLDEPLPDPPLQDT